MGDIEQEINLDEITDESVLQSLLEQTEDIDDRKAIRARIQELRATDKARREEKVTKVTDSREERLQEKQRKATEQKQRTMAMYDQMAKSAPAGGPKKMDIGIYRSMDATPPGTPTGSISGIKSSDLVEDALRQRQRAAEERKKRILAAYESAARSAPSGVANREVNFDAFKKADVSDYTPTKIDSGATFGSSGGVAKVTKGSLSQPGTPISPGFPGGIVFPKSGAEEPDAMEKMIRQRQQEAEERKRRTLAAYDIVGRQGAGPKLVCLEEFKDIDEAELKQTIQKRTDLDGLDTSSSVTITKSVTTSSCTTSRQSNFGRPQSGSRGGATGGVARSGSDIKDMLLRWSRAKTKEYDNVQIENFSGSWANGLAFAALIHHFFPDAYDYKELDSKNRRRNFELAFKTAEEKADVYPLIEVEDMLLMKDKPDWKCVFTYIQSIYRKLHDRD